MEMSVFTEYIVAMAQTAQGSQGMSFLIFLILLKVVLGLGKRRSIIARLRVIIGYGCCITISLRTQLSR